MKNMEYYEKDGGLWFSYQEKVPIPTKAHAEAWKVYESSGKIPKTVIKKGKKAIKGYAEQKIKKDVEKQKADHDKLDKFAKSPNWEIDHHTPDQTRLLGRIVSAEDNTLVVRLNEPYQGEEKVHFGWASAVCGKYIFEKVKGKWTFTVYADIAARELLVRIYNRKKHYEKNKETIDLAEQLSESSEIEVESFKRIK